MSESSPINTELPQTVTKISNPSLPSPATDPRAVSGVARPGRGPGPVTVPPVVVKFNLSYKNAVNVTPVAGGSCRGDRDGDSNSSCCRPGPTQAGACQSPRAKLEPRPAPPGPARAAQPASDSAAAAIVTEYSHDVQLEVQCPNVT